MASISAILSFPSLILMISAPGQGKSYTTKFILNSLAEEGKLNHVMVFCNTLEDNEYDFIPQDYCYSIYNEEKIQTLLDFQKQNGGKNAPPAVLILDDVLGKVDFNSTTFQALVSEYRHYNLTVIICVQYLKAMKSPLIYECTRYAFIFYTESEKIIKVLYEYFGSGISKNWRDFRDKIQKYCVEHHCMIIDKKCTDKTKKSIIYKAPSDYEMKNFIY